jgi:hypothetical protein
MMTRACRHPAHIWDSPTEKFVDSEGLRGKDNRFGMVVYLSAVHEGSKRWHPPHENEPIDDAKVDQIEARLVASMKVLEITWLEFDYN